MATPDEIRKWRSQFTALLTDQNVLNGPSHQSLLTMLRDAKSVGFVDDAFINKYQTFRQRRLEWARQQPLYSPQTGQPLSKVNPRGQTVPVTGADLFVGNEYKPELGVSGVAEARQQRMAGLRATTEADVARLGQVREALAPTSVLGNIGMTAQALSETARSIPTTGRLALSGLTGGLVAPPSAQQIRDVMVQRPIEDVMEMTPEQARLEAMKPARAGGFAFGEGLAPTVGGIVGGQAAGAALAVSGLAAGPLAPIAMPVGYFLGSLGGAALAGKAQEWLLKNAYGTDVYEKQIAPLFETSLRESGTAGFAGQMGNVLLQGSPVLSSGIGARRTLGLVRSAWSGRPVTIQGTAEELGTTGTFSRLAQATDGAAMPNMVSRAGDSKYQTVVSNLLDRVRGASDTVANRYKTFTPTPGASFMQRQGELGKFVQSTPGAADFVGDLIGEQFANLGQSAYDYMQAVERSKKTGEPVNTAEMLANLAFGSIFIGNNRFTDALGSKAGAVGGAVLEGAKRIPGAAEPIQSIQDRYRAQTLAINNNIRSADIRSQINGADQTEYEQIVKPRQRINVSAGQGAFLDASQSAVPIGNGQATVFNRETGEYEVKPFSEIFGAIDDTATVEQGKAIGSALGNLPTQRSGRNLDKLAAFGGQDIVVQVGPKQQQIIGISKAEDSNEAHIYVREVVPIIDEETGAKRTTAEYHVLRVEDLEDGNKNVAENLLADSGLTPSTQKYSGVLGTSGMEDIDLIAPLSFTKAWQDQQRLYMPEDILKEFPTIVQFDEGIQLQTRVIGTQKNGDVLVQVFSPTMDIVRINPTNIQNVGRGNISTATTPKDPIQLSDLINEQQLSDAAVPKQDAKYDVFANPDAGLHSVYIDSNYQLPLMFTRDQLNELSQFRGDIDKAESLARRTSSDQRQINKARSQAIGRVMGELFGDNRLPEAQNDWLIGSAIQVDTPNGLEWGVVLDTTDAGPVVALPSQDFKPVLVQESAVLQGQSSPREDMYPEDVTIDGEEEMPEEAAAPRRAVKRKPRVRMVRRKAKTSTTGEAEVDFDNEDVEGIDSEQARQIKEREEAKPNKRLTESQARAFRGDDKFVIAKDGGRLPLLIQTKDANGVKHTRNIAQNIVRKLYADKNATLTNQEQGIFDALSLPDPKDSANDDWYRNAYQGVSYLNNREVQSALAAIGEQFIGGSKKEVRLEELSELSDKQKNALIKSGFVLADGVLDNSGIKIYSASERGLYFGTILNQTADATLDNIDVMKLFPIGGAEDTPEFSLLRASDKAEFSQILQKAFAKTEAAQGKTEEQVSKSVESITTLFDTMIHGVVSRKVEMVLDGIAAGAFSTRASGQERIPATRKSQQVRGHQIAPLMDELRPSYNQLRQLLGLDPRTDLRRWMMNSRNRKELNLAVAKLVDQEVADFYSNRMPTIADFKVMPQVKNSLGQYLQIYDPVMQTTTKVLMAFRAADVSTFVHEIAHAMFEAMPYAQKKEISGALGHTLRVPTITHSSVLTYEAQEKFAYGLEVSLANIGNLEKPEVWTGTQMGRGASKNLFEVLLNAGNVVDDAYHALVSIRNGSVVKTKQGYERTWSVPFQTNGKPNGRVWLYKNAPLILSDGRFAICDETIGTTRSVNRKVRVKIGNESSTITAGSIKAIGGPTNGLTPTVMQTLSSWIGERRKAMKIGLIESTPAARAQQLERNEQGEIVRVLSNYQGRLNPRVTTANVDDILRAFAITPNSDLRRDFIFKAYGQEQLRGILANLPRTQRLFAADRIAVGQENSVIHGMTLAGIQAQIAGRLSRLIDDPNLSPQKLTLIRSMLRVANDTSKEPIDIRKYYHAFNQAFRSVHGNRQILDMVDSIVRKIDSDQSQNQWEIVRQKSGELAWNGPAKTVKIINRKFNANQYGQSTTETTYLVNLETGFVSVLSSDGSLKEVPKLEIVGGDYTTIGLPDSDLFKQIGQKIVRRFDSRDIADINATISNALKQIGLSEKMFQITRPEVIIAEALLRQASRKNEINNQSVKGFNLSQYQLDDQDVIPMAQSFDLSDEMIDALRPLPSTLEVEEIEPVSREKKYQLITSAFADKRLAGFNTALQFALLDFQRGNKEGFRKKIDFISRSAHAEFNIAFSGMDADWDVSYVPSIIGNDAVPAINGQITVHENELVKVLGRAAAIGKKLAQANVFVTEPTSREEVGYNPNGWFVVPSLTFKLNRDIDLVELRMMSDLAPTLLNGATIERSEDGTIKLQLFMVPSEDFGRSEALDWSTQTKNFIEEFNQRQDLKDAGNPIEAILESEGKLRLWNIGSAENGGKGSFREYQEVLDLLRSVAPNDSIPSETIQTPEDVALIIGRNNRVKSELESIIEMVTNKPFHLPNAITVNTSLLPTKEAEIRGNALFYESMTMPEDAHTDIGSIIGFHELKVELARIYMSLNIQFDFMPRVNKEAGIKYTENGYDYQSWNIQNPYGDDFQNVGVDTARQIYYDFMENAARDIADSRHLFIFQNPHADTIRTGTQEEIESLTTKRPLLAISPFKTKSGEAMLWADVLTAIQSTLQHGLYATAPTDPKTLKLNAYGIQAMMTQEPLAIMALANETALRYEVIHQLNDLEYNGADAIPLPMMPPDYWIASDATHRSGIPQTNLCFTGINQVDDRLRLAQLNYQLRMVADQEKGQPKNQVAPYRGTKHQLIVESARINIGGYIPLNGPKRPIKEIKELRSAPKKMSADWANEAPYIQPYDENSTYWQEDHDSLVLWAVLAWKKTFTNQMHRAIWALQNGFSINVSDEDRKLLNQEVLVQGTTDPGVSEATSHEARLDPSYGVDVLFSPDPGEAPETVEFELLGLDKEGVYTPNGLYFPSAERFMAAAAALIYEIQTKGRIPTDQNGDQIPIYRGARSWAVPGEFAVAEFSEDALVSYDFYDQFVQQGLTARMIIANPSDFSQPLKGIRTLDYTDAFPNEEGWLVTSFNYQSDPNQSGDVMPDWLPDYISERRSRFKKHINYLIMAYEVGYIETSDPDLKIILDALWPKGKRKTRQAVSRFLEDVRDNYDPRELIIASDENAKLAYDRVFGLMRGLSEGSLVGYKPEDVILVHDPYINPDSNSLEIDWKTGSIRGNFSPEEIEAYKQLKLELGSKPTVLPANDESVKHVLKSFYESSDAGDINDLLQTLNTSSVQTQQNNATSGNVVSNRKPNLLLRSIFMINQLLRTGATGDASPILMQNFIQANLLENPAMMVRQIRLIGQILTNPNLEFELPLSNGQKILPGSLRGRKLFDDILETEVRGRKNYEDAKNAGLSLAAINREKALAELKLTNPNATYNDIDELGYNTDVASDMEFLKHLPGQGTSERFFALSKDVVKMNTWDSMVQTLVELGYNPTAWEYNDDGSVKHTTWTRALTDLAHLLNVTSGDIKFVESDDVDERIARIGKLMFFAPRWLTSRLILNSWGRGMLEFAGARFGKEGENWAQKLLAVNGMSRRQLGARDAAVSAMHGRLMYKAYLQWLALILGIYAAGVTNPHTMKVSVEGSLTKFQIGDYSFRAPGAIMAHIELTAAVLEGMNAFNAQKPGPESKGKLEMVWDSVGRVLMSRASPIVSMGGEILTGRDIFGESAFIPDEAVNRFYQEVIQPSLQTAGITEPKDVKVNKAIARRIMWWWLHDMMEMYDQERKVGFSQANAMLKATALGAYAGLGGRISFQSERLKWQRDAAKRMTADPMLGQVFSGAEPMPEETNIYEADSSQSASIPVPAPLIGALSGDTGEAIPGYE